MIINQVIFVDIIMPNYMMKVEGKKKKSILIKFRKKKQTCEQTHLMGPKIAFLVQCLEVIYQYQKEAQTQTLALC